MRAAFAIALAGLAACSNEPGAHWQQETALEAGQKLGGCVVADLDRSNPGDEIAVVAEDGSVYVATRSGGLWSSTRIAELPGEMIQIAAADVTQEFAGAELFTVGISEGGEDSGGPGALWFHSHAAAGWHSEQIFEDPQLLHAVCIGDIDPDSPGLEVLVAGYSRDVSLLYRVGGAWTPRRVGVLPAEAKGAASDGDWTVVVCTDGSVVRLVSDGDDLELETIGACDDAAARVAVRDGVVLVCANDGALRKIDGEISVIYQSTDRLRGAVWGEFNPTGAGIEAATAGYDGKVTVHVGTNVQVIGTDTDKFHHLAAGNIDGLGTALVACGYSGRVLVHSLTK